ncbi:uncharacterized protein LOC103864296 [Brassica rapa]|uniref:Uncharacterized protein n=2 Tax=Brassica TaxID=3705 RepID=A0A3P6CGQ8_BRACM|nr:uncharacterized protein LOC103864296 [Brassica rapa]XP_013716982.1 uncharacterized protein BNAA04G12450D [Brassica napus]CAF2276229.1 unnamed protein product [Brassica napus]CAG7906877.1 unnamed protein product [Brassica rapa]CDY15866.1 BnaA04g12450D [Brassica napus]VDD13068.1 unnamed protein product [Brassica rapa]
MSDPMGETGFSGESAEMVFSETEMAAAELLMQLSEEETVSCSSSNVGESGGGGKRRHEDVCSRIGNDGVKGNCNLARKMKKMKEKKFRSLESIYMATKEIRA